MKSVYSSCLLYELISIIHIQQAIHQEMMLQPYQLPFPGHYSVWWSLVSLERQIVSFMQHASVFYNISGFFLLIYLILKEFFYSS